MSITELPIETLIQGGAVAIALLLTVALYLIVKMHNKTINNHISHSNETMRAVAEEIGKANQSHIHLAEAIGQVSSTLQKNNYILDENKKVIDQYNQKHRNGRTTNN